MTSEERAKKVLEELSGVDLPLLRPKGKVEEVLSRHFQEHASDVYNERARVLAMACKMALYLGYTAGIGRHPETDKTWDPQWRFIIFIDLSDNSQVSWHIHDSELYLFHFLVPYHKEWDKHSTELKYKRMEEFGKRSPIE